MESTDLLNKAYENIRIVEWNINACSRSELIKETIDKIGADIVVLTEVRKSRKSEYYNWGNYKVYASKSYPDAPEKYTGRVNSVIIAVKNKYIKESLKEVFDCGKYEDSNIKHMPECLGVSISYSSQTLKIYGLRMRNTNIEKLSIQKDNLLDYIFCQEKNISIVIGDFNYESAIKFNYSFNSQICRFQQFINEVLAKGYVIKQAQELEGARKNSYYSRRNPLAMKNDIGTRPDMIFVSKELERNKEKVFYYLPENCPSDHAMLIVDINLK